MPFGSFTNTDATGKERCRDATIEVGDDLISGRQDEGTDSGSGYG